MQATPTDILRLDLLAAAPNVGGLISLCEENYRALRRLAPALPQLSGQLRAQPEGQSGLLLTILEQAPYTTRLRLTHVFDQGAEDLAQPREPDAELRAYHDAAQVEILGLRQTILPVLSHYDAPALAAKWRANLFVSRWLGYCLRQGYRFPDNTRATQQSAGRRELLPSA